MQFNRFIRSVRHCSERLFQKRSIIVISDQQTNHYSISGRTQLAGIALLLGCVGAGSYFTGSYMSARSTLQAQGQALKTVANSRVENSFQYFGATLQPQNIAPVSALSTTAMTDPTLGAVVGPDKLTARIAFLETRVHELKTANEEIIQTVKEKTNGKIADLESVIRKTGLDPAQLKKAVKQQSANQDDNKPAAIAAKGKGSQGGPFIPADIEENGTIPQELFGPLDQLAVVSHIIDTLPLGSPIQNADPQSTFGQRLDPFTGRLAFHPGTDLAGPAGSKIMAANSGKVINAGYNGAYGNMVDIDHGYGIVTRYGHMSQINVKEGRKVSKGQVIGVQGSTGRSTGAHLHYEVRYNNHPINPVNFLKAGMYVSQN